MGEPYIINKHCRVCWLFHHDERYKKKWTEPTLIEKAKNFAAELQKRINSNFLNVTDSQYAERLQICEGCPNRSSDWTCNLCGCVLNVAAKWATKDCPAKKWPLVIISKTSEEAGCGCQKKN